MSVRKKRSYSALQHQKRPRLCLEPGLKGFICTCGNRAKEKDCLIETYRLLNEWANKVFQSDKDCQKDESVRQVSDEEDVDGELLRELMAIREDLKKSPESRRFQAIHTGVNGVLFIRSTVPDPVKLVYTILTSFPESQPFKALLKLLPVEVTCKAYMNDILKACDPLFAKYFTEEGKKFAIVFNHRNNNSIDRDEVIEKVANLVVEKNNKNKADLKYPDLTILIDVIKNVCCIAVVSLYSTLCKYNIAELGAKKREEEKAKEMDIV